MSPTSLEQYIEQTADEYVDELIARTVKDIQQEETCRSCHQFMSVMSGECSQCDKLVDQFVSQTMFKVQQEFCPNCSQLTKNTKQVYELNEDYKMQEFHWGTIEEFSVTLGKKMIEEYIKVSYISYIYYYIYIYISYIYYYIYIYIFLIYILLYIFSVLNG